MIENNPTNVSAAFEILLEEVETEIDFIDRVGANAHAAFRGPTCSGNTPCQSAPARILGTGTGGG